jgi:carboxylesterase type B
VSAPDTVGEEDCLYLNVYTPRRALVAGSLPVIFWIYGGGYMVGDAYQELQDGQYLYDGAPLAGRFDVVVVTTNYRLSALGFNTWTQGEHGETGTQAMEDQRLAMKWTQQNIKSFGGDPSLVTIMGESAGAFSVMYHLVSPPSWPLFSRAIMQSGTSRVSWFFQPAAEAKDLFHGWASAIGCPTQQEQGRASDLQCLQQIPAQHFAVPPSNYTGRSPAYPVFPVGPVVDGTEYGLLDIPLNLVEAGMFSNVPLLIGANKDGGSLFKVVFSHSIPGMKPTGMTADDVTSAARWAFPSSFSKVLAAYPASEFASAGGSLHDVQMSRMVRDGTFQCSDRHFAMVRAAKGLATYVYVFSFNLGAYTKFTGLGDFHAADLPFVFRNGLWFWELQPFARNAVRMANIMGCKWANFARAGHPEGEAVSSPGCQGVDGTVVPWPDFSLNFSYYSLREVPQVVQIQTNNTFPDDEFPSHARCEMWETVEYAWHDARKGGNDESSLDGVHV